MRNVRQQQQAVERDSDSITAQQRRFFEEIARKQHQVHPVPAAPACQVEDPPMLAADAGEERRSREVQGDSGQGASGAWRRRSVCARELLDLCCGAGGKGS